MDFSAVMSKEHVITMLKGETRRGILRSLGEPLLKNSIITDLDAFCDDVERREKQITTQIGNGVAFPHARSTAARRLGLTVGIAPEPGLAFSDELDSPCRLFFMIAIPSYAPTAHLPVLQRLAEFGHDQERIEKLLESKTPAQVAKLLVGFKGRATSR